MTPTETALLSEDDDYTSVWHWLEMALSRRTGDEFVFILEVFFSSLRKRAPRSVITDEQRAKLSVMSTEASDMALRMVESDHIRDQAEIAFDAVQGILSVWSTPMERRSDRDARVVWEWFCFAEMFEADLKNRRMATQIEDRRRRAGVVQDLPLTSRPDRADDVLGVVVPFPPPKAPRHDR